MGERGSDHGRRPCLAGAEADVGRDRRERAGGVRWLAGLSRAGRDRRRAPGRRLAGDAGASRGIYAARLAGEVGRPSLDGARVVFTLGTPSRSAIESDDLTSGRMRTLRAARRGAALSNPSLLGGRLLFERTTRCYQQLRIGPALARRRSRVRERTLLSLPSTVPRDTGYQRGYTHAYNGASKCPNRAAGRAARCSSDRPR